MKSHDNLEKIITQLNRSAEGDLLSAIWHFLCFSAMAQSDISIECRGGKIHSITRNGEKIEPTVAGINRAMKLGPCTKG